MYRNNKGCTIFEFFSLIVTFEIVIILLVPHIFKIIRDYREETFISISKLIAANAENTFIKNKENDIDEEITCESMMNLGDEDYLDCNIYMNNKTAYVTLKGEGKYENMNICAATKNSSVILDNCNDVCVIDEKIDVVFPYEVKSYNSCINYTKDILISDRGYTKSDLENFCNGNDVNGWSFSDNIGYLLDRGYTTKELVWNHVIKGNITEICVPKDVHKACYTYDIKEENNKKYLEIIDYDESCGHNIEIPYMMDGMVVKGIGENAFIGKKINSVKFPSTIEYIGNNAFRGYGGELNDELNGVKLMGILDLSNMINLKRIGYFAFADNRLTKVIFPNNITKIEGYAFAENDINGVLDLSNTNLIEISEYVFSSNKIANIKLPLDIKSIGYTAFAGNQISGELDLSLNTKLTSIGNEAFSLNNINSIKLPVSIEKISNEAFSYNKIGDILDLSSNINLSEIGNNAFFSNDIFEILFPESILKIGKSSFDSNSNLIKITNLSSNTFDWNLITNKGELNSCNFVFGKCENIIVTKKT